jgi:spore coat protein U-like protein
MKRFSLRTAALAALLALGGAAHAADSANLGVTANVVGNCQILSTTPVDFGTLDPASTVDATGAGAVSFWCTKNATFTLSMNDGLNADGGVRRMKGPGATDFIAYNLTAASTSGQGQGRTSPLNVAVNGLVAAANYADAAVGAYSDTVVISITP